MEHEGGECEEIQAVERAGQARIIANYAAKVRGPGEVALH